MRLLLGRKQGLCSRTVSTIHNNINIKTHLELSLF